MQKKIVSMLVCVMLLTSVFAGCEAQAAPAAHEPYEVEIYSWQTGTFTYIMGMAWADLINKHSDWLKAVSVESLSSTANELMVYNNPDIRAHAVYFGYGDASYRGSDQFAGHQNTRSKFVLNLGLTLNGVVTCDPNVKTVEDLAGKTFAMFANGSMNNFAEALLSKVTSGIAFEDMDNTQRTEAAVSRRAGATFLPAFAMTPELDKWSPNPAGAEMMARANYIGFLSVPLETMREMRNEVGGPFEKSFLAPARIPAGGIGPQQVEDWDVFVNATPFMVDQDMPDEVVTEMLRIFVEHADELVSLHPQAAMLTPEIMAMYSEPAEMHPAAKAYFESIGVTSRSMADFLAAAGN